MQHLTCASSNLAPPLGAQIRMEEPDAHLAAAALPSANEAVASRADLPAAEEPPGPGSPAERRRGADGLAPSAGGSAREGPATPEPTTPDPHLASAAARAPSSRLWPPSSARSLEAEMGEEEEEAAALRAHVALLSSALAAAQAAAADARAAAGDRLRSVAAERDALAAKLEASWAAQAAAAARAEQLQERAELAEVSKNKWVRDCLWWRTPELPWYLGR